MNVGDLPQQPEIYLQWLRRSRQEENRATAMLLSGALSATPDVFRTANAVFETLTAAFTIPAEVEEAYESWRQEWNAGVDKIRAERQRRINAREVSKIRSAACPSCYATHAGEC